MSGPQEPNPRRWVILWTCCLSLFIVGLDVSALNLALPSIRDTLGASPSELQWILDAYTLVIASLLIFSGSLADRVGRRRIFRVGLVVFGVGSVLCAFSTSGLMLVLSRALQAIGGSMLNPVAMSIVTNTFTDPVERAKAIGYWGSSIGVSLAFGPLIGGVLVETLGWQSVFWMNVPVVIGALVLVTKFVPESKAERARRPDPAGQLLVMVLLASLTFAIIEGRGLGWTSAAVIGAFACAVVSLCLLLVVERRVRDPLIDPRFFRSLPFSGAVLSAIIGFAAMAGFQLIMTLYLQSQRGLSPLVAGLMTLPLGIGALLFSPISGRMVIARGPRMPLVLAGVGTTACGVLLVGLSSTTNIATILVAFCFFGAGFGLLNTPITNAAVSGMPRSQAGVAAAVASSSRQVGSALGVAAFGALAFAHVAEDDLSQFAESSRVVWWVVIGCGLALIAIAFAVTTEHARRTSARVSEAMALND